MARIVISEDILTIFRTRCCFRGHPNDRSNASVCDEDILQSNNNIMDVYESKQITLKIKYMKYKKDQFTSFFARIPAVYSFSSSTSMHFTKVQGVSITLVILESAMVTKLMSVMYIQDLSIQSNW